MGLLKQFFQQKLQLPKTSGQISIIPKPELRGFWGSSLIKPPFRVTSADVVIICPENMMPFNVLGSKPSMKHYKVGPTIVINGVIT